MTSAGGLPRDLEAPLGRHPWGPSRDFLGLEPDDAAWEGAGAAILPVPYEATTSWGSGTREGPGAILEASRYVELYDEELDEEPWRVGIATLPELHLTAAGPEQAVAQLRSLYDDLLEVAAGRWILALGGEHSISSAPAAAWAERLKGDLSILQLDAHADLRDEWDGTPWSHACVMRRILEHTDRLVQVGLRALTREERSLIEARGLTAIYAYEMRHSGWVERAVDALGEHVYITFDLDFFDPSLVPATGTPEPGGGSWWDALDLLGEVFRARTVVGADIVELAPRSDEAPSATVAAKLAYKMVGFHASRRRGRAIRDAS